MLAFGPNEWQRFADQVKADAPSSVIDTAGARVLALSVTIGAAGTGVLALSVAIGADRWLPVDRFCS